MVAIKGEQVVEVIEPWNDGEEVEVSYYPVYSQIQLSSLVPAGIDVRARNDSVEKRDIEYLCWIIEEFTDQSYDELLNPKPDDNKRLCYLIMKVIEIISNTYEAPTWEEYSSDTPSFLERGSLGVK